MKLTTIVIPFIKALPPCPRIALSCQNCTLGEVCQFSPEVTGFCPQAQCAPAVCSTLVNLDCTNLTLKCELDPHSNECNCCTKLLKQHELCAQMTFKHCLSWRQSCSGNWGTLDCICCHPGIS